MRLPLLFPSSAWLLQLVIDSSVIPSPECDFEHFGPAINIEHLIKSDHAPIVTTNINIMHHVFTLNRLIFMAVPNSIFWKRTSLLSTCLTNNVKLSVNSFKAAQKFVTCLPMLVHGQCSGKLI